MTELTQAELAEELGFWPATTKGWKRTWQRCGRDYKEDFEQFGHVAYDFQLSAFEAGLVFPLESASTDLGALIEEVNERASRLVPEQLRKLADAEGVDLEQLMAHPGGDLCVWFSFERVE